MTLRASRAQVGTAALSLALLLVVTGCGGGGGDRPAAGKTPTPDGFKRTETRDYAFAIPAGWSVQTRPARSDPTQTVTEATGPKGTGGVVPLVLVGTTPDYRSGLEGLVIVNETSTLVHHPSSRQLSKKDVSVPAATGAKLIESEVVEQPAKGSAGEPTPVRMFDVVALSRDRTAVNLYVRVPVADIDASRARAIVASLELR